MEITMLKGKIHRATVTQADLNYVGSITIDESLMEASHLLEYEQVQVVDLNNGARLETYVIAGARNSGIICLNGAAARSVAVGDQIIIMSYLNLTVEEAKVVKPYVVLVDQNNQITKQLRYEKHGLLNEMMIKVKK